MVSEAKKPLVFSMGLLALFSLIVLSVSAYMIINNLKSTEKEPSVAIKEDPDSEKRKKMTFKDAAKRVRILNRMRLQSKASKPLPEETLIYCSDLDALDEGTSPEWVQDLLDTQMSLEYAESEEDRIEGSEFLRNASMIVEKKVSVDEEEVCFKIYDLTDAFGIEGSKGKFGFYSQEPREIPSFKSVKEFLANTEGLKVSVDKLLYLKGKPCHVVVVSNVDSEGAFTDENIEALIDHLFVESTPWPVETLTQLALPSVFGIFSSLSPEDVNEEVQNEFVYSKINNTKSIMLSNALESKQAVYFGSLRHAVKSEYFGSLTAYSDYIKRNGLKFIMNESFSNDSDGQLIVHFASKTKNDFDLIRANLEIISAAILARAGGAVKEDSELFPNRPDLKQVVLSNQSSAFLLIFPDSDCDFSFFGPCEREELLAEFKRTIVGFVYDTNSDTKVFKIVNYDNIPGQVAHRLTFNYTEASSSKSTTVKNGAYTMEIRPENLGKDLNERIAQAAVNLVEGPQDNLAAKWEGQMYRILPYSSAQVLIWKQEGEEVVVE